MEKKERKKKLTGPWHNVQVALWLFGLALLAIFDWWWPGILVLIGISVLFEALIMRLAPQAFKEEVATGGQPKKGVPGEAPNEPTSVTSVHEEHPSDLLPSVCPKCGGPLRNQDIKWVSAHAVECPFCNARIPLNRE